MNEIVVGVDGSDLSMTALEWAAEEARRRHADLRIVYAIAPWLYDVPVDPRAGAVREWIRNGGQDVVDRSVARARERVPGLQVSGEMVGGQPAAALLEAAGDALMVVVGSHGAGARTGLVLGSMALQVASHARIPAVVVRREDLARHGEVAVGVDGSPGSQAALAFAFEEAALRRSRLRAVLAWTHPGSDGPGDMQPVLYDPDVVSGEMARVLAESLAGWREKFPDVEVVQDVVHAHPTRALAGASARADLLVVGTRGRGGFASLLLGSVSHAMLHRAHGPMAIVPAART